MLGSLEWLISYQPYGKRRSVKPGDSRKLSAQGVGDAKLTVITDGCPTTITLRDVMYVPKLRRNLVSLEK